MFLRFIAKIWQQHTAIYTFWFPPKFPAILPRKETMKVVYLATSVEKKQIIAFLSENILPDFQERHEKANFYRKCANFTFRDGHLLDTAGKIVIAADEHEVLHELLTKEHTDNCHIGNFWYFFIKIGVNKLWALIKSKYVGIKREKIRDFVSKCLTCALHQPLKSTDPVRNVIASQPWERIQIDLMDFRKFAEDNRGYCWILNVIDVYSKFLFSVPLRSKQMEEVRIFRLFLFLFKVAHALQSIFRIEGNPRILQSDNGCEFTNELLRTLCAERGILIVHGRPRHPQSQGQVERCNQTILRFLAKSLHDSDGGKKNWVKILRKKNIFIFTF